MHQDSQVHQHHHGAGRRGSHTKQVQLLLLGFLVTLYYRITHPLPLPNDPAALLNQIRQSVFPCPINVGLGCVAFVANIMSSMLVFWESLCLLCMCMYTCVYLCMVQGTEPRSSYMLSKYFITKLQCSLFVPVLNGGLNRLHMFLTPVVLLLLYLHKKNLRYSKQDL